MWPVRGHILENYGNARDGTHNDGINIAAPRGAAVQATDSGVVAYAGNELRGYGNLILIKHSNGWISAYAHCDLILVKKGEKVARGQTIARVGSTGSVAQPQLHFELRRGDKPVNPREYLAPLPTAAGREARAG
jgi:murein DD-endopeptidase MepM/ murein hydrolase activator NlpD